MALVNIFKTGTCPGGYCFCVKTAKIKSEIYPVFKQNAFTPVDEMQYLVINITAVQGV